MWVLSTDRAELHFFPSPEKVPGGYAALSHVWNNTPEDGPPEQSFQDVWRIQNEHARNLGRNPRNRVSEKIRRFCKLAESHGYQWAWIDTCCIDKTSSAELSEAINSMFRYYALAGICYGYLRDFDNVVFSQEDLEKARASAEPYSDPRYTSFRQSVWFRRGWTLQELMAPHFFVFLSRSWEVIGTKADLAEFLEREFRIPATVLRLEASHTEFSIAQRMSWFGARATTRPEDEAYCLLGLFDIHMPPLYGEGRNAFRRLQEEIMKQSTDTTLFAWTGRWDNPDRTTDRCLFAVSPADFGRSTFEIVYTPPPVPADTTQDELPPVETQGGDVDDMTFAVTPNGIRAYIPIFTWRGEIFADLYWSSREGRRIFLHLEHDPDSPASSSHRPSYRVSMYRLAGEDQQGNKYADVRPLDGPPSWKEVVIRHRPPLRRAPGQLPDPAQSGYITAIPMQVSLYAPVRFPAARIQQFLVDSWSKSFQVYGAGLKPTWTADSNLPTAYVFAQSGRFTIIKVGQCQQEAPPTEEPPSRPTAAIWATVTAEIIPSVVVEVEDRLSKVATDPTHDCLQDHVALWPEQRRTFELGAPLWNPGEVTLSFAPCPLNPERTLILDVMYRRP
ncbi:HET-domain-containing protein [Lentinus brumalis]|uniref:HET-domain-containing protein n=1 Tax=Lentinus brumalis TaxID=2498619 RepID=A0A371CKU5_9APHY|nr:HET-domain-containing protein [Polyporus brumalis]